MKITDIKTYCLAYSYKNYIADGYSCCKGRSALLVLVETDCRDMTGIGECATFGAPTTAVAEIIEKQLKPLLVGEDPSGIEYLYEKMTLTSWANGRRGLVLGAISGIDIALWDLLGKAAGMPVYKLLGANRDRVRTYASAGFYAPNKSLDDLKREFEGYREQGYTAYKMKIGRTDSVTKSPHRYLEKGNVLLSRDEDLRRVEAVREVIGPDTCLMLDMNCTWTVQDVLASRSFFEENRIYWIEEPILNTDLGGYKELCKGLPSTMVAASESAQGLDTYLSMLQKGCVDVVQAGLGWTGGFTGVRRIAALTLAYNKIFSPHTFFSAVMTAANAHLAASLPNVPFIESEVNENPFRTELLETPLETDAEMNFVLSDRPGLGISLNMDTIEKYSII